MIKFCAISDLHGHLPKLTKRADLLLIAGDICPTINHSSLFQLRWLNTVFYDWLLDVSKLFSQVLFIAGNHDFVFADKELVQGNLKREVKNCYIEDQYAEFSIGTGGSELSKWGVDESGQKILIYGSPWSILFGSWAFMKKDWELGEYYNTRIRNRPNILISHGPAFGYNDLVPSMSGIGMENAGSKTLLNLVCNLQPDYLICGHIHEGYGTSKIGRTQVINCSLVNEKYEFVNEPVYAEI